MRGQTRVLDIDLIGHHLTIRSRYEAAGALNDALIAIWFLVGSVFFLRDSLVEDGTWLFIVGSAQLLIKPLLKLAGLIHVGRIHRRLVAAKPPGSRRS